MISIAIDGPSGSGKSTVAKILAKKLGIIHLDTGAIYRAIAYLVLNAGVNPVNQSDIQKLLNNMDLKIVFEAQTQKMFLDGKDITDKIRTNEISALSSKISAYVCVREYVLSAERDIAEKSSVIMDGRDIGTVVLPDADVKFFLTALPEVRAMRRYKQLKNSSNAEPYEEILKSVNQRDFNDIHRKAAPLKCAEDAVVFDNSDYTPSQTVQKLLYIIRGRTKNGTK